MQNWKDSKFARVVELTRTFVKINSENPIEPEIEMQRCIEAILSDLDFEFFAFPYKPGRNNLLAFYPSLSKIKEKNLSCIMFSGHQDTVVGYDETNAESAEIKNGKIYGRGACDMKGGIASFLTAIKHFMNHYNIREKINEIKRGICLSFTVDEEMGCTGIKDMKGNKILTDEVTIDFCIIGEPSSLFPVIGHKGIVWFMLEFNGLAAHGSVPQQGDNAIEKAVKFLSSLDTLKSKLKEKLDSQILNNIPGITPPTINVGVIRGGEKANIVPDHCSVKIDRRITPNETVNMAKNEILEILEQCRLTESCVISESNAGESYLIPNGVENRYFKEILEIVKPYDLPYQPFMEGYTEADVYYRYFGIPTMNLGPGSIAQAHKKDEYVEIEQLLNVCDIYLKILQKYVL